MSVKKKRWNTIEFHYKNMIDVKIKYHEKYARVARSLHLLFQLLILAKWSEKEIKRDNEEYEAAQGKRVSKEKKA